MVSSFCWTVCDINILMGFAASRYLLAGFWHWPQQPTIRYGRLQAPYRTTHHYCRPWYHNPPSKRLTGRPLYSHNKTPWSIYSLRIIVLSTFSLTTHYFVPTMLSSLIFTNIVFFFYSCFVQFHTNYNFCFYLTVKDILFII